MRPTTWGLMRFAARRRSCSVQAALACRLLKKCPFFQVLERLAKFLLRVHDDWTIPGNRLLQRLTGDQEESNPIVAGLYLQFVTAVKQHERAVIRLRRRHHFQPFHSFSRHSKRAGCVTELSASRENVGEGVAGRLYRQCLSAARRHGDVQVHRIGCDAVDWTFLTPKAPADHAYVSAVVVGYLGD